MNGYLTEESSAVLDETVLRGQIGDDSAFLEELLVVFAVTIDAQVVALLAAAARGDSTTIAGHAHAIKGAAANIGAGALLSAAAALERAALQGDIAAHALEALHSAWRKLQHHPAIEPFVKKANGMA